MKIHTKVIVLAAIPVLIISLISGILNVWLLHRSGTMAIRQIETMGNEHIAYIRSDGERQLTRFRDMMYAEKKDYLRSEVQTAVSVLESSYRDAYDLQKLQMLYQDQLSNAVNTAYAVLETVAAEPGLSRAQKQAKARRLIGALRYGPENKDYFWINDEHPRMVMHPYKPQLDGKDLSDFKDPNGKRLFVEFAKVCREHGEGFVDYFWPRYGADTPQPKLSYVRLFAEWGWIIGSGIYIEVAETRLQADAMGVISALRYGREGKDYFWINDLSPTMIMHPYKPSLVGQDISGLEDPNGKRFCQAFVDICLESGEGFVDYHWPRYDGDTPQPKLSFVKLFDKWNWIVGTGVYVDEIETALAERRAELEKQVSATVREIDARITSIKKDIRAQITQVILLTGSLVFLLLGIMFAVIYIFTRRHISEPLTQGVRLAEGLSEGDLSQTISVDQNDEIGRLSGAMRQMVANLNDIVHNVRQASTNMTQGSEQVSTTAQNVSQAATQQASAVQELAATIEQMAANIKHNAENADEGRRKATETLSSLQGNVDIGGRVITAMDEINRASSKINEIITTVRDVAFQTNLLALNAAVEAARAGEQGQGFAVVAEEVRSLAQRSGDAAGEIARLIEDAVSKVSAGDALVRNAQTALQDSMSFMQILSQTMEDIAASTAEQSVGAEELSRAISQIDTATQQNASTVEKLADTAQNMNADAHQLSGLVETFKVADRQPEL